MDVQIPKEPMACDHFVGGEWIKGDGEKVEVFSPYDGSVIGTFNSMSQTEVDAAIEKARVAQQEWAKTPIKERTQVMFNFRNILLRDLETITHIKCSESGKTFAEGRAGLMKGIEVLEFAISLQNLDMGGKLEVSRGVFCEYRREPLGVVASITPFNFPAMVPMWTIPIALTLGNAYVWKPSEKTPLTSLYIANALKEAGLPDGVLTVLQGRAETVNALLEHQKIKAVAFVGSTKIAKLVYEKGSSNGKRVLALGGAKNHIVLLPDANSEISSGGICNSFTGCAGQRCMAASVLLAVGDVDSHIDALVEKSKGLELGSGMGAIITKEQVEFLNDALSKAESEGAKILLDGREAKAPSGLENGYWFGPTIIDNVKPGSFAHKVELFGPIISIIRCQDISEAMVIENSSSYGNACSVFTNSGGLAEKVISRAKAGMVGVNIGVPVPREPFSFAGINDSKFGHGEITGEHSLNFWSNMKKVTTKWENQADNNWMS